MAVNLWELFFFFFLRLSWLKAVVHKCVTGQPKQCAPQFSSSGLQYSFKILLLIISDLEPATWELWLKMNADITGQTLTVDPFLVPRARGTHACRRARRFNVVLIRRLSAYTRDLAGSGLRIHASLRVILQRCGRKDFNGTHPPFLLLPLLLLLLLLILSLHVTLNLKPWLS